jgi:putative DNA methylase
VSDAEMEAARKAGTVRDSCVVDPATGRKGAPMATLRGPAGLRLWENGDLAPRPGDVFQERLYCIRYVETYYLDRNKREVTVNPGDAVPDGCRLLTRRHYVAPDAADLERERRALALLLERFREWQEKGYIPSAKIPPGVETDRLFRERGWTFWHHLFNPRQLLVNGYILMRVIETNHSSIFRGALLVCFSNMVDYNSKLSRIHNAAANEGIVESSTENKALNPLYNFGMSTIN